MSKGVLTRKDVPALNVRGCSDTVFYSTLEGQLCQWLALELPDSHKVLVLGAWTEGRVLLFYDWERTPATCFS